MQRRKNKTGRGRVLRVGAVLLVWFGLPHEGRADSPACEQLRAQIEELKIELAKLRAEHVRETLEIQNRLAAQGRQAAEQVRAITGMCGDPCANDGDGDGLGDCEDPCPCEPTTNDRDGDGMLDCLDPCPDDATNACIDPCRRDSDGDGANDCDDPCPYDSTATRDSDGDLIPECKDPCPQDPTNGCYDPCLLDQDRDGVGDCRDICPWGSDAAVCVMPPGLCVCPMIFDPVCGDDGRTYGNACDAGCAGASVVHNGPCTLLDPAR